MEVCYGSDTVRKKWSGFIENPLCFHINSRRIKVMYCGNCGTKNDDNAVYCEECGAKYFESSSVDDLITTSSAYSLFGVYVSQDYDEAE